MLKVEYKNHIYQTGDKVKVKSVTNWLGEVKLNGIIVQIQQLTSTDYIFDIATKTHGIRWSPDSNPYRNQGYPYVWTIRIRPQFDNDIYPFIENINEYNVSCIKKDKPENIPF